MDVEHTPWTVTSWNTHGSARPDTAALADAIRGLDADVVAVQEIQRCQARKVAESLGWHHVWARKHYPYSPLVWWLAEGHAILTPHLLSDPKVWEISRGWSDWTYRHRVMLAATATRPDGASFRIYDVHFSCDDDVAETALQAERAAALATADIALVPGIPVVVAGDFNDEGRVAPVEKFRPLGLRDAGTLPANPSSAPTRRIDHVLVPESASVINEFVPTMPNPDVPETGERATSWSTLSDHLPVTIRFTLPRSGS